MLRHESMIVWDETTENTNNPTYARPKCTLKMFIYRGLFSMVSTRLGQLCLVESQPQIQYDAP